MNIKKWLLACLKALISAYIILAFIYLMCLKPFAILLVVLTIALTWAYAH